MGQEREFEVSIVFIVQASSAVEAVQRIDLESPERITVLPYMGIR